MKNPSEGFATPEQVFEIAKEAHEGQVDLAGKPYINHVVRVANMMVHNRHKMIALLHDVMEDSAWTEDSLMKHGVPMDVVFTLKRLTKTKGQPYDEYIEGLTGDIDAVVVKMADLRDNMDVTRLPELGDKEITRLKKYHRSYRRLEEALGLLFNAENDDGTEH